MSTRHRVKQGGILDHIQVGTSKSDEATINAESKSEEPYYNAEYYRTLREKEYLTKKEAAILLETCEKTIERMMKEGLVYIKWHKTILIKQTDFTCYLEDFKVEY